MKQARSSVPLLDLLLLFLSLLLSDIHTKFILSLFQLQASSHLHCALLVPPLLQVRKKEAERTILRSCYKRINGTADSGTARHREKGAAASARQHFTVPLIHLCGTRYIIRHLLQPRHLPNPQLRLPFPSLISPPSFPPSSTPNP